jgi:hypothetical protein
MSLLSKIVGVSPDRAQALDEPAAEGEEDDRKDDHPGPPVPGALMCTVPVP